MEPDHLFFVVVFTVGTILKIAAENSTECWTSTYNVTQLYEDYGLSLNQACAETAVHSLPSKIRDTAPIPKEYLELFTHYTIQVLTALGLSMKQIYLFAAFLVSLRDKLSPIGEAILYCAL